MSAQDSVIPYVYYGERRPYKHQLETIKFMLRYKRGYLFLKPGCGKSACALWFADRLFHHKKIKKVLIIAPLSTIYSVWVNEINIVCPYYKYSIVHGPDRVNALKTNAQIYITNPDSIRNNESDFLRVNFDIIIIDEVTNFANATSKRSKAMQRISHKTPSVYGLTGSPIAGGVINSFGLAKAVNPSQLPTPYFTKYRNMILYQVNMYEYIEKDDAIQIVNKVLQPAIKYTLEECSDLPDIVYSYRFVKLAPKTMELFNSILKEQIAEYNNGLIVANSAALKSIRLVQILTGFAKTEEGESMLVDIEDKLKELVNIYHECGNKLVIFCQSVFSTKIITEYFLNHNIQANLIYGDVSIKQRTEIIDDFQTQPNRVLVAQIRTMSHGVTLTSSNTIVFFGVVNGNEYFQQAVHRIRRLGQTQKQHIIKLVSTKWEIDVFKRLEAKEFSSQALLDMYKNGNHYIENL